VQATGVVDARQPQDLVRDGADARGVAMASPPTRDIVPTAHDGEEGAAEVREDP
jgi:hypothetical protein